MESLKLKLALAKTKRPQRLTLYDVFSDMAKTEAIGLVANEHDFDLGTPNLTRNEDVLLVASNSSSKEALVVSIKWRPDQANNKTLVTQISKLTLVTGDGSVFVHENIQTYAPVESSIHPGRFMQFGCSGSSLKMVISSPYRRARLVFRGQMKQTAGGSPEQSIYVKLNLVLCPVTKIFDFNHQFDANCFRKNYKRYNLQHLGYEEAINSLLYHDRHEQMVRMCGNLLIESKGRVNKTLMLWGFHSRHFPSPTDEMKQYKRIYGHTDVGHSYHIGQCKRGEDAIEFGYVCYEIIPQTEPIQRPLEKLSWDEISKDSEEFSVTVLGQNRKLDFSAKRRDEAVGFFDATMENTNKGWAFIVSEDGASIKHEQAAIEKSVAEYKQALAEGKLCKPSSFDGKEEPLVVAIDDNHCLCSDLVGAKASSLAELRGFVDKSEIAYSVPHAFVLTRFAHDLLVRKCDKLKESIERLTTFVSEQTDLSQLPAECEKIQRLISEELKLPEEIGQEVGEKLAAKYGERANATPFAVRSSSWGEDEEDMSAAGQLSTLLNVRGLEEIQKAVMKCFASKFSYENIEYKRQHGLRLDLPMAVVIQEMIECEKAGVMFTCDPATGNDSVITITANYGLGESVVSGQSDPDSIRVKRLDDSFLTEQVIIGQKNVILGQANEQNCDRSRCCLNDAEIMSLAKLGNELECYHRCPRDIEWGFTGNQLHLFQSRPVTGLEMYGDEELIHEVDLPTRAEVDFFSRANIGEVMSRAASPMFMTYQAKLWELLGYRINSRLIGAHKVQISPHTSSVTVYDSYHTFFSLKSNVFFDPGADPAKKPLEAKMMEIAIFGHELEPIPDLIAAAKHLNPLPNMFVGRKYILASLPLRLSTMWVIDRDKKRKSKLRKLIRNCKLTGNYKQTKSAESKMRALLEQLRQLAAHHYDTWENHLLVISLANEANGALAMKLAKYIKDPIGLFAALTKFLGNSPNVISAEIPERISLMAKRILSMDYEEKEKILALNNEQMIAYLESGRDEELKRQFDEFLVRFGHRCYNEFEICEEPWSCNKSPIIDMLRSNCIQINVDEPPTSTNVLGLNNKQTNEQILESLKLDGLTREDRSSLLKSIVPRSQLMVAARERTKDVLIEQMDLQREASRMLAKEMKRQLRIPNEQLMYFVLFDELEPLIRDHQPAIVMQAQRRRQLAERKFSEVWKFDEVIRGAEIVPNHLKPSRELDERLANAPKLHGTPASSGRVRGKVCLVDGYAELHKVKAGSILLTHSTDIGFSPVFPMISGIITEVGGLISHGAVVAREYGLPSLLGIPDVTRILQDGEEIILDADNGLIIRLGKEDSEPAETKVDDGTR